MDTSSFVRRCLKGRVNTEQKTTGGLDLLRGTLVIASPRVKPPVTLPRFHADGDNRKEVQCDCVSRQLAPCYASFCVSARSTCWGRTPSLARQTPNRTSRNSVSFNSVKTCSRRALNWPIPNVRLKNCGEAWKNCASRWRVANPHHLCNPCQRRQASPPSPPRT